MASKEEKNVSVFKKDKSGDQKMRAVRYPDKTTINLARFDTGKRRKRSLLLYAAVVIAALAFGKFAVYDRIGSLLKAQAEYAALQDQVAVVQAENARYGAVKEEYDKVTDWYMTDEEKQVADKMDILDMVEEDVAPYVGIRRISAAGNIVTIETAETTLDTVSRSLAKLQADARNTSATLTTTSASKTKEADKVMAVFVITYAGEGASKSGDSKSGAMTEEEKQKLLGQLLEETGGEA